MSRELTPQETAERSLIKTTTFSGLIIARIITIMPLLFYRFLRCCAFVCLNLIESLAPPVSIHNVLKNKVFCAGAQVFAFFIKM